MTLVAKILSGIALMLTFGPALLVFQGAIDLDSAKLVMLVGTILWFASAPVWMNKVTANRA